MALFEIEHLTFAYPTAPDTPCLKDVSLTLEAGEYLALCGKSGSGKTTLLRQLKSVLAPHGKKSGLIRFDGRALEDVDAREQAGRIGYVMQDPDSQIVTDKVWHELAFGLESLGCDQRTMRLRVAEMASYFGIQDWFHREVAELSGGQKQLLNLASVMAMQPDVLILDEPTSQLDPIAAAGLSEHRCPGSTGSWAPPCCISEHRLEDVLPRLPTGSPSWRRGASAIADPPGTPWLHSTPQAATSLPLCPPLRGPIYAAGETVGTVPADGPGGARLADPKGRRKGSCPPPPCRSASCPESSAPPALELKELWFRYEKDSPGRTPGRESASTEGQSVRHSRRQWRRQVHSAQGGVRHLSGPTGARLLLDGVPLEKRKGKELFRGNLALLPQDPKNLFVKKTVREELAELLGGACQKRSRMPRSPGVAAQCDLTHLLDSHPYDLSGGEQQRAALGKVLLTHPKLLLLDEPTKGLDCFFKAELAALLKQFTAQGGTGGAGVPRCGVLRPVRRPGGACSSTASSLTVNTPRRFFADNSFYTTAANRMSRHIFRNAVTAEDVAELCRRNGL